MLRVVVVGQTPPPFGGQAVMIKHMLDGHYEHLHMTHVRMAFSRKMNEVGTLRIRKLLHLAAIIPRILFLRLWTRSDVLYYPPAGSDCMGYGRAPMYRDLVILNAVRWAFRKTVFHFHAAGIGEVYPRLNRLARFFFRRAYFHPDCAIILSKANPPDGELLSAKVTCYVPNGIEDCSPASDATPPPPDNDVPVILFVGVMREGKGVIDLLDCARTIRDRSIPFQLRFMGHFASPAFESEVHQFIDKHRLQSSVKFLGVLTGDAKWKAFRQADVFCLPSFFETFGLVALEAMMVGLPVIATRVGGLPDLVADGESGFLVPARDVAAMTDKLTLLLKDPQLRQRMGHEGRRIYLDKFTIEAYRRGMEQAMLTVAQAPSAPGQDQD